MPLPKLLVATGNPGKMQEYRRLLAAVPFRLVSLEDAGIGQEVEETGRTFAENAALKARAYAGLSGLPTLADDSGLEVDALGGAPGVYSARYGEELDHGPPSRVPGQPPSTESLKPKMLKRKMSDADRVALLLRNLQGVPWRRRTARFYCVIAVAAAPSPDAAVPPPTKRTSGPDAPPRPKEAPGRLTLLVGSVAGMIQYEPAGEEGFGYDPVFYLPSYGLTMAQLPLDEKNRISHRAHAAGKAVKQLEALG